MFITKRNVAVQIEGSADIIFLKERLTIEERAKIQDAAARISMTDGGEQSLTLAVGAFNYALLCVYIADWRGPSFVEMKPTLKNISALDPSEPLVVKAGEMAAELWGKHAPKATEPAESPSTDGASDSQATTDPEQA
jgi:hypothetical protein